MRVLASLLLVLLLASATRAAEGVDFRARVYPLLHDRCFRCHQGSDAKSGVRLDLHAEMLPQTRSPGGLGNSSLIQRITTEDADLRMPPTGQRLRPEEIQVLRDWITQGVKWDDTLLPPETEKLTHWSFHPVARPAIPKVKADAWVRNPIDAFIAATHDKKRLSPTPEADRRTMLRRLSLDLIGLPPTPEELQAFEKDTRPDAYEQQVERLLASPQHGETWGRHWLDIARYADSEGYESDHVRPYAWRYRDWVVKAFNDDKPYDSFVREQLAGDELTPYRDENLVATGFLASARLSSNEEDKLQQLNDLYVDITNATFNAFLGLTVQCAQCHDHKFDPISQKDYYRLQGFFLTGLPYNYALRDPKGVARYESAKPAEYDNARRERDRLFDSGRAVLDGKARQSLSPTQRAALNVAADRRSPAEHAIAAESSLKFQYTQAQIEKAIPEKDRPHYNELKKHVDSIEEKLPHRPQTFAFHSPVTSSHTIPALPMKGFYPPKFDAQELARSKPFVLRTGDPHQRGEPLNPGWPQVFGTTPPDTVSRSALAKWLTDPAQPLTARVWVNRIWQFHFGRGLVDTASDFGLRGARPSHPELLDWLAAELVSPANGPAWSTKHIHRLIVNSATYRQSSRADPKSRQKDPENTWLTRWSARRLGAEAVRDAMLAVSGELDARSGGAPDTDESTSMRRAIYLQMKRQKPPAGLTLFDGPTAATESCPKRITTATPLHALFLLNNPFPAARAKALAARVRTQAGEDHVKQARTAFALVLCRAPTTEEAAAVARLVETVPAGTDALTQLCHALLAANEFLTLE